MPLSARSRRIKQAAVSLVILCAAASFFPIRFLAAPKWDVWVINQAGAPLSKMEVCLRHRNYAADSDWHHTTLITDQNGYVTFQAQYRAASLLQKTFNYIVNSTNSALDWSRTSSGNYASVEASSQYEGNAAVDIYIATSADWTGSPATLTSKIIALLFAQRVPYAGLFAANGALSLGR